MSALILSQCVYYFITAVWPIVHIESFMAVTGPKTDIWLVKTVGALLLPVTATMAVHLLIRTDHRPVIVLGTMSCIAFIVIDMYYSLNDVISRIYLADAAVQFVLLMAWIFVIIRRR